MAHIVSASSSSRTSEPAVSGVLHEIRQFWQTFIVAAFDPYRPEQHYMRGPGPACRAKSDAPTSHSLTSH